MEDRTQKKEALAPAAERHNAESQAGASVLSDCLSPASFWQPVYLESSAWLDHAPFAFWLIDAHRPRSVVELGTHGGYSYFAFCQAVQFLGSDTRCYAVDHWKGDEHAGFYDESIFERVRGHNDAHYATFSRLVRSSFDDALEHFSDGSVDLLHIDGRHFYEDVKHDFESWLPKLSNRAVVLFHDTNVKERGFGVFRLWEEIRNDYPSFEFLHGHGLGVLGYGSDFPTGIKALFAATSDPHATVYVRDAYNRLGAYPKQALQQRQERNKAHKNETALKKKLKERESDGKALSAKLAKREGELGEHSSKLRKREEEVNQLSAKLEKQKQELNTLSTKLSARQRTIRKLKNSTSWRLTSPLRALSRGFKWLVRNALRVMRLVWWIMTGQFGRAAKALRPYYRRYVPLRVKKMIPNRVRRAVKRRFPGLSATRSTAKKGGNRPVAEAEDASVAEDWEKKDGEALKRSIAEARKTFDSEDWLAAVGQWESILARCRIGREAEERQAKLYTSVARRMANLEGYKAQIDDYVESREALQHQRKARGEPKIAVYSAISGGYDSLKLPEVVDPRIDYILFTDTPMPDTGIWQVRPITFLHEDPTRTARFVKTHPHWLLPEYDIVVWIDSNIMILGDIYPLIDEFLSTGKAIGAIPHPLRKTIYEEVEACGRANKDDLSLMQEQVAQYRAHGFVHDDLIESNLMMSNLRVAHSLCEKFSDTWWAEIDRYSRRDQLSKNYALIQTGIEWHRLCKRPNSVRNHSDFCLVAHDSGKGPASKLLNGLQAPMVDPYSGASYLEVKQERLQAQRQRKIDVVVCVHNALGDVQICLDSIARTRASDHQRLIIIDDGSEETTASYLRDFARKDWVVLYRNERASGYTKAANKGLAASSGEFVILLNSDTVVTSDWAEKLADAVFTTPGAGIVGPMSNAASHQSIPEHRSSNNQTAINVLPPGMTAEDMNSYCEQWTMAGVLPRTPLVHGFCFGVTREVIDTVGFMDEEKFPRGYGEENDYCFRAADNGFALVVATHTYVFHAKSKSYVGPERIELMKAGSEALTNTYGRDRIQRAVKSMQGNPLLAELRRRTMGLYGGLEKQINNVGGGNSSADSSRPPLRLSPAFGPKEHETKPHFDGPVVTLPYDSPLMIKPNAEQFSIGVHLHLYYLDLLDEFIDYLSNIPVNFSLYVSVIDAGAISSVRSRLEDNLERADVTVKHFENRGRDIGPFIVGFGNELVKHDVVLRIHSKRSPHAKAKRDWRRQLLGHLVGSRSVVSETLSLFAQNPQLGMIFPEYHWSLREQISWGTNFGECNRLAQRLSISLRENELTLFPAGSMFWARGSALRQLFHSGIGWNDFPAEQGQVDGTLAHAVERLFGKIVQENGFNLLQVRTPGPLCRNEKHGAAPRRPRNY